MNCREFREQLAEFIGGELDAEQHAAAQSHMQSCQECRERARGLEAAAAALEAGLVSPGEAERRTAALTPPHAARPAAASGRVLRVSTVLRYAAIIMLAFAGGYLVRGWRAGDGAAGQQLAQTGQTVVPPVIDAVPGVSRELADLYVRAAQKFPDSSTFSRSLLMLARR
jgi:anti-sigma factor RsiW